MSKILKSIVGLCLISASIGLAAAPAKAESKAAQCQRLNQALTVFSRQFSTIKDNRNPEVVFDQWLKISAVGLKQLQNRQFSDPKVRGLQQTALNEYVALHNAMAGLADAVSTNDRAAAIKAFDQMSTTVKPEGDLRQQFIAYCGRPK